MKTFQRISIHLLCLLCAIPAIMNAQGFQEVYENIALLSYEDKQQLEVFPGGDAEQIRFGFKDARAIQLLANGEMRIISRSGSRIEKAIKAYQEQANGEIVPVAVHIEVEDNTVKLQFGAYEMAQVLVIDLPGIGQKDFAFLSESQHLNSFEDIADLATIQ